LLQALVKVMAPGPYLGALIDLVDHESDKVRRKALKLFADRLSKVVMDLVDLELLPVEHRERQQQQLAHAAMSVWERLPRLLRVEHLPSAASRQQALAAAQLAIRAFGGQQRAAKVALGALPALLSAVGKDGSSAVRGSALACLAAMAVALNTQLVPHVPKIADVVLSTAEGATEKLAAVAESSPGGESSDGDHDDAEEEQTAAAAGAPDAALEVAAAVAALESLAEALGAFMSPYLPRLLQLLLHPVVLGCAEGGAAASAARLRGVLVKAVPPRLLLEPLTRHWEKALGQSSSSSEEGEVAVAGDKALPAGVLLQMLGSAVSAMEPKVAAVYHEMLFGVLLKALDTRRRWMASLAAEHGSSAPSAAAAAGGSGGDEQLAGLSSRGIAGVESAAVNAMVSLTMKLSENKFRPLFFRLLDWAANPTAAAAGAAGEGGAEGSADASAVAAGVSLGRTVALLAAVGSLSRRLKGVFVPYFKYLLDICLAQLSGAAAAAAGMARPKKKRRKSEGGAGVPGVGSGRFAEAVQLAAWLGRVRAVRALHLLFMHDTATEQRHAQERLDKVLGHLVGQLQEGPEPGSLLAQQLQQECADVELDGSGGAVAALGAVGKAVVAATGDEGGVVELPDGAGDVVGVATLGALLQAALAGKSDMTWKPVHHAVLMATRKGSTRGKLLGVGVVSRLAAALQEEYLVLLPEALPFVAELMEDGEAAVEAAVQGLVKQLEELSGEQLEQYLKT
jgi:U3 small nucleolar RNA-associated protein 10